MLAPSAGFKFNDEAATEYIMNISRRGSLMVCYVLSICATVSLAKPRPPWPPLPEFVPILWHDGFNVGYFYGITNAQLSIPDYGQLIESWSGYALQRSGTVTPYIVPAVGSTGHTNVACDTGTIRLWLKPYWSSASLTNGT